MRTKTKAREVALKTMYKLDIAGGDFETEIKTVKRGLKTDESSIKFYDALVKGTRDNRLEIDKLIEESSENWSIRRMAVVDRNILRLAVFELLYCPETPYKVIIDEAINLAKRFGSADSSAFVNGILDRIARKVVEKI